MSKFTDLINGFIHKNFTQEVTCCNCGKKGKTMFFSTLSDGNKVCSDCKHELPDQFKFKAKENTIEDFKKKYSYIKHCKNDLEPIFNPSEEYSYGKFQVDPVNRLCRVNNSFVFELANIKLYAFDFKGEDFKQGFIHASVKGDVYLSALVLNEPFAMFENEVIKFGAKARAEKQVFTNVVIHDKPEEMKIFLAYFDELMNEIEAERTERKLQDLAEAKAAELLREKMNGGYINV